MTVNPKSLNDILLTLPGFTGLLSTACQVNTNPTTHFPTFPGKKKIAAF